MSSDRLSSAERTRLHGEVAFVRAEKREAVRMLSEVRAEGDRLRAELAHVSARFDRADEEAERLREVLRSKCPTDQAFINAAEEDGDDDPGSYQILTSWSREEARTVWALIGPGALDEDQADG